ncbi:hypothetical protein T484DRAFT_1984492 [Baffinella frigidus]|nr:hypothetical protein T484DRAFT_1984492 [Cryptophyta sp. CCMP2293]
MNPLQRGTRSVSACLTLWLTRASQTPLMLTCEREVSVARQPSQPPSQECTNSPRRSTLARVRCNDVLRWVRRMRRQRPHVRYQGLCGTPIPVTVRMRMVNKPESRPCAEVGEAPPSA